MIKNVYSFVDIFLNCSKFAVCHGICLVNRTVWLPNLNAETTILRAKRVFLTFSKK